MSESQKFQLGTIGALSLSVVSSVSIVICNKALISTLGFTFGEYRICIQLIKLVLRSWVLLCDLHAIEELILTGGDYLN